MTPSPGDIIATKTLSRIGHLKVGDKVGVEIKGIRTLIKLYF